jgi:hypothetical protein
MDAKGKSNPLEAGLKVVDARQDKVVIESGQAKWASKQSGLTWSDDR